MRKLLLILCCFCISFSFAQKPKNGTYYYSLRHAEHPNLINSETDCKVVINGEKITVIYLGNNLSGLKKGNVLAQGILLKHKSGKWIIGKNKAYSKLDEIGGCTGGPNEIDIINKYFWIC